MPTDTRAPRPSTTSDYRLDQLEKQLERDRIASEARFTVLIEKLNAMNLNQQVHMKQTEIAERNNDKLMEDIQEVIEDLKGKVEALKDEVTTNNVQNTTDITKLKVGQSFMEKFGPPIGTSAGISALLTLLIEGISRIAQ